MSDKIITGLASFGMSGKVFHAPLLFHHYRFHLKTIVERSKNEVRGIYPNIQTVRTFDELLRDDDIELIIVNTPDHTHADLALKALEAGKHVIVEKPFTQTVQQGEMLIELAQKKNLVLSVFQNRRWDGDFLTVQKIIEKGFLGRLVEYESHFDRYRNYIQNESWKENPETGTGTLYNLGSHMIDQAITLFGMPEAVMADIRILRTDGKVDDCYDLKLYYPQIKVSLKASYLVREPGPRFVLNGTLGSFLKYGIDPQEEFLKLGKSPSNPDMGKDNEANWGILNSDVNGLHYVGKVETINGNYLAFYDNIWEVVRNKASLAVKPQAALNIIRVINAAFQSNLTKEAVKL